MSENYLEWKVGDPVVCVDDAAHARYTSWALSDTSFDGLTAGRVYTIRKIDVDYGVVNVWLNEIVRPRRGRTWAGEVPEECGYDPRRFRKVQPRNTDISIFTAIAKGHRVEEDA